MVQSMKSDTEAPQTAFGAAKQAHSLGDFLDKDQFTELGVSFTILNVSPGTSKHGKVWHLKVTPTASDDYSVEDLVEQLDGIGENGLGILTFSAGTRDDFFQSLRATAPHYNIALDPLSVTTGTFHDLIELTVEDPRYVEPEPLRTAKSNQSSRNKNRKARQEVGVGTEDHPF